MTRHKGRKQRGGGFAWPLLAFGAVLLVAAGVLFATSRRGSAATAAGTGGSAQITVEPAKIDYGYVKFGNDETFKLKVTNTGTGDLRFTDTPYIEVVEGC